MYFQSVLVYSHPTYICLGAHGVGEPSATVSGVSIGWHSRSQYIDRVNYQSGSHGLEMQKLYKGEIMQGIDSTP